MDYALLYLGIFCGALALLPLFLLCRCLHAVIEPHIRVWVAYFKYSKLRFGGTVVGVSGLKLSVLVAYITANALLLGIATKGIEDLGKRTAIVAATNLMLVFLGGKTNPLADFLHIPLPTYYLAHRCIAVIATTEVLLHAGISLYRHPVFDSAAKSGTIVSLIQRQRAVRLLKFVGRRGAFLAGCRISMVSKISGEVLWVAASVGCDGCAGWTHLACQLAQVDAR